MRTQWAAMATDFYRSSICRLTEHLYPGAPEQRAVATLVKAAAAAGCVHSCILVVDPVGRLQGEGCMMASERPSMHAAG